MGEEQTPQEKLKEVLLKNPLTHPKKVMRYVAEDKQENLEDVILGDEGMLVSVGSMWQNSRKVLETVIGTRIASLFYELAECQEEEIHAKRQAMLELTAVLEDFERYYNEFVKRNLSKMGGVKE